MSKILSYNDLKKQLPYRSPMLLLDRARLDDATHITGLKLLSIDEHFFQGHFPGHPIMPGVLQIEAMFQTAQLLVREIFNPGNTQELYIQKLSRIKFRKPVVPGDRLIIRAEMTECDAETKTASFKIVASTDGDMTCQGDFVLSCRPLGAPDDLPEESLRAAVETTGRFQEIEHILPHRFPFVFIDRIYTQDDEHILASKNFTGNEPFTSGYESDYAVFPNAVLCEFAAQVGCANLLANPSFHGCVAYYGGIKSFESFAPVFPGDEISCDLKIPPPGTRMGQCSGDIMVGTRLIARIVFTFAIVDPKPQEAAK